ncbi:MAG TPA: hypothetical protein VFX61_11795 [Micromonosporaceae bacterium]|nr:hypothetical protein [Micromonosporaceae bacterium]
MNPEYEESKRRSDDPRSGQHPERPSGRPGSTPQADDRGGRTTYEAKGSTHEARAVPREPLPPTD